MFPRSAYVKTTQLLDHNLLYVYVWLCYIPQTILPNYCPGKEIYFAIEIVVECSDNCTETHL